MRPVSRTRPAGSRRPLYHPHLVTLEERLPLGDGVLGLLVGASLLPAHAGTLAAVPAAAQSSGEGGVLTPRLETVTGGFTPPARPEKALAVVSAEVHDAEPDWTALTDLFAAAARRCHDALLPSPQREQGPDAPPLLAPRAGEERGTARVFAAPPALVASAPHTDAVLLATLVGMRASAAPQAGAATPAQETQVKESFGQLPLSFEQNVGQTDAQVHFFTRGPGYGLYLTSTEAVMVLNPPQVAADVGQAFQPADEPWQSEPRQAGKPAPQPEKPPAVVRMQLVGANATPAVTGHDEQPGKVNYFLGNDSTKWRTNVATFGRVAYDEVYPGIDLVWYGNQNQLEYDFVVSPGADPSAIRLNVTGAERVDIDAAGDLLVHLGEPGGVSPGSTLRQHKPFVYQTVGDTRQEVASRFVLEGQQVRFAVGAYNAGQPLVIDPVLIYSTYLGGSGDDERHRIALDPATGDIFVTGRTASPNFPTANPFQPSSGGGTDAFVTRLRADGSALVYSTYLGGSGFDYGNALATDPTTGDALLTGATGSIDFPTASPLQPTCASCPFWTDAFVARLRADGSALVYSTYLGGSGSGDDVGSGLAVDPATGDALLTGHTSSTDFPTANPFQANHGGLVDAFVARLRADGSALVYSTYLGGSFWDDGYGIAVDPTTGDAFVTGDTSSTNFPTANPFQATYGGLFDGYVARLRADGAALVYSTYLGGSFADVSWGIAVDPATGNAHVTGTTVSTNFPTANALQAVNQGGWDVFVARLNASGAALVYSTYLGGIDLDDSRGVAVDPATGDAFLAGFTFSTDFPTANPLQSNNHGQSDAFVARLRADGGALVYSTYLGGNNGDYGDSIAVDPRTGDALVAGETRSIDFPTANPLQANHGGGAYDAFVTRIGSSPVAYYYVYPDGGQVQAGVPFDVYVFALDAQFNVIADYTGLILFYATDPLATTPVYYQYQRTDRGIAAFPGGLTFNTPGLQELYVFDWPGVQVFGYAAFDVRP